MAKIRFMINMGLRVKFRVIQKMASGDLVIKIVHCVIILSTECLEKKNKTVSDYFRMNAFMTIHFVNGQSLIF